MGVTGFNPPKPILPPTELHVFKNLDCTPDVYCIPEIPEKREVTDKPFLILFIFLLVLLVPFMIYTVCYSDLKRLTHGYDNCGNICDTENTPVNGINCTGRNMSGKPYLKFKENDAIRHLDDLILQPNECVEDCNDVSLFQVMHRCFLKPEMWNVEEIEDAYEISNYQQALLDLKKSVGHIVALAFLGLGFCFMILVLFRCCMAIIVWFIVIGVIITSFGFTIYLWVRCSKDKEDESTKNLAIVMTIFTVIFVIIFGFTYKKISLVIHLFRETTKAIFSMPLILLVPIWIFLMATLVVAFYMFLLIMYVSSGMLTHIFNGYYGYIPNGVMIFTIWYTSFIILYLLTFLRGCQHMIIAGAVSTWYFARDKNMLGSPIRNSFYNMRRFHLGTVAFGSLVITIMTIIRNIIKAISKNKQLKIVLLCCVDCIEEYMKYLSNQAYIETAMHGQNFYKSGKRAAKLLIQNALSTLAVNSIGDIVLNLAKILVVILTVLSGYLMDDGTIKYFWMAIFLSGVISLILADLIFTVFEICVDTIFLCYCEDQAINDGLERPYYSSVEILQFMNDVKIPEEPKKQIEEEEALRTYV